jgi:hypothetical protein
VESRGLAVSAAAVSAPTTMSATAVESASTAAMEASATDSVPASDGTPTSEAASDCAATISAAVSATAVSTTAIASAVSVPAAIAIASTVPVSVAAAKPGSGTDEEAAVEPGWAVVSVGRAGIGIVVVVAPLADWRAVIVASVTGTDANAEGDLGVGVRRGESKDAE